MMPTTRSSNNNNNKSKAYDRWSLTFELSAVLDVGLPITRLLLDVKGQARGTSEGKESLDGAADNITAVIVGRQAKVLGRRPSFAQLLLVLVAGRRLRLALVHAVARHGTQQSHQGDQGTDHD